MEFNGESNQIEGSKKYNFYMGGDGKNRKKSDILVPNKDIVDLSGARLKNMKDQAGVKSDEEYLRELKEVEDYNESIKVPTDLSMYKFNGNAVVVRLFKQPPYKLISGMFIDNKLSLPYQDKQTGKYKIAESPLQFIYRGVINYISEQCSDQFKTKFKIGDIVDLRFGLNLMQQRTWLSPEDYYEDNFQNYFNINENMIEKGITQ